MPEKPPKPPSEVDPAIQEVLLEELKFLLAELRTAMSGVRTGIALMTLPLSGMGLLLVTSRHHSLLSSPSFKWIAACSLLVLAAGLILIFRALVRIRQYQRQIKNFQNNHPSVRMEDRDR